MSLFVVDASVAAKWLFPEEYSENAARLLHPSNRLHAPEFLLLELHSVLSKNVGRKLVLEREQERVLLRIRRLPIKLYSTSVLLDHAYFLSVTLRISVYDCLYLALAALLDSPLVTADRRICRSVAGTPLENSALWVKDIP